MPTRAAKRSPEAPAAKLDWPDLLAEALVAPGRLSDTYCRFYNYSFLNQVLLMSQGVEAPVATYKRWQELGRQVLKGSKAKAIVRPIVINKKDEAGEVEESFRRFKMVNCLFPVTDTEGDELPPVDIPTWDYKLSLDTLDIKEVPFEGLNGNVQGYSHDREVAINPVARYPLKTRFHEMGHVVLGHTTLDQQAEYVQHRGLREFQAESTAYLCMNELDLTEFFDPSESRGYIQHWLQRERPPDPAIRQVFGTVDTILKSGRRSAIPNAAES